MTILRVRPIIGLILAAWFVASCSKSDSETEQSKPAPAPAETQSAVPTPPAQTAPPETQTVAAPTPAEALGFAEVRLDRVKRTIQKIVDQGKVAGVVTLVARHGKTVSFEAFGKRDLDENKPMEKDSIFRIASMTKPIIGVAMMVLYEQGKWQLDDPVANYIPEFANLKVMGASPRAARAALARPMTMRELMTHTAGFAYGLGDTPVDALYRDANLLDRNSTLQDMIGKLAKLPLAQQPGTKWQYSIAVDVQGYLVEKLSGQPLDQFLSSEIFEPLGMKATGFVVAPEHLDRLAKIYTYDEGDKLIPLAPDPARFGRPEDKPKLLSGGGGLFSTAEDYFRFCQMLLNGGTLDGKRILAPQTVALMRSNQLPAGVPLPRPGQGFGLDVAVAVNPAFADGFGAGTYWWSGSFGTWFWIDPTNDLVVIGLVQHEGAGAAQSDPMSAIPNLRALSRSLVYQALIEPNR